MSINKFTAVAFLLMFLSFGLSVLANDELKFERISLEKGAALNLTYCMLQDHKGFIWFGTMYGLVKYDGKHFQTYKNNPDDPNSISFDDIISLYEDSKNNIWIGTWGGGLNKFNPCTERFTRYINNGHKKGEISGNIIWAILEDNDGNMWFGTETGGLNKFNAETGLFSYYTHLGNNPQSISSDAVRLLYKDKEGVIWIGNQNWLSKYNKKTDDFTNYLINENDDGRQFGVSSIFENKKGNFLIGTPAGLYIFNKRLGKFNPADFSVLQNKYIHSICRGKDNSLWIGTNDGLFSISLNNNNIKYYVKNPDNSFSLSGNHILNLMIDRSGILWANAYGTGINKLKPGVSRFTSYSRQAGNKLSLSSNSVKAFCVGKNKEIWIGTADGLNRFDKQTREFKRFYTGKTLARRITSLLSDRDLIWIGTVKGIKLFNTRSYKFETLPTLIKENKTLKFLRIPALLKHKERIYIGTYGNGLFVFNAETNSLKHYIPSDYDNGDNHTDYILYLYQDRINPKIIWFGTYGGLIKMNTEKNTFEVYRHNLNIKKSLSNDYVFSILRDSHNNLWIGTANGLNRLDEKSGNFKHYFEKDGLPNSVISSIIEDDNSNLWISTNYGISEFNLVKNKFKNYSMKDGLQNNFYFNHSSLRDDDGEIYFGGTNGFDVVQPSVLIKDNYVPGVYITSVKNINSGGNQTEITPINGKIELNHEENFIEISFISLDYNNPSKNFYKYKLEGIDRDWINARNSSTVSYTNLPPGEYIFHVKGSNSNGIFNTDEAALKIVILPPFWKTIWFNISFIIILMIIIYLLYKMKVNKKIKRALEIQKIREEESEKLRKKTAVDFHDELGHRLTRISILSEIIKRKLGDSSIDLKELLNKITANANELYEGTKDFIWAIDPQKDSLYELIIRLKDFGDDLFEDSDILFEVKGLEEPALRYKKLTMDWKRHLALIFKEGMNNSLKHGNSSIISLDYRIDADNVEIILSDNGIGFVSGITQRGNGLNNMKKRAGELSAQLDVISSPGKGTQISFKGRLPENTINYN